MLEIYDSLSREKRRFVPMRQGEVRMYVCGITVYDYIHLGHARMLSVFDTVQRYLRFSGYRVTFVRNITDIDDKIIARAASAGEPWQKLAERFIVAMNEDCARLGLQRPDLEPRATEHIPAILAMIARLIDRGYAYLGADGDVLYSVRKFAPYGRLSGKKIDDLRAGARVQIDAAKHDPLDFVLWKHAKTGEPAWPSPWGPGRPGWHIECSAMATELLGSHFDLHGGGMDLMFPHHENEIAQSCAACDSAFVNVWMHNGFVNIDDTKMSKSLGNFFTVRNVLDTLRDPEVMRLFLLSSHYRGPINYSAAQLEQADETLLGLYRALNNAPDDGVPDPAAVKLFCAAMDDDFNTPEALAVVQHIARDLNVAKAAAETARAASTAASLRAIGAVLGLLQRRPSDILHKSARADSIDERYIEGLLERRRAARREKKFAESDRIRDELKAAGVSIDDKPGGITEWRRT